VEALSIRRTPKRSGRTCRYLAQTGSSPLLGRESESTTGGCANHRLVPISNYLLPPPPASAVSASNPAPFKRPEPLKRTSLPFTSSVPSSPILERPEDIRRSPSPETIARMSMTGTGSAAGPDRGSSTEGRRSREGSLPLGLPGRRSRESTLPSEIEVVRPRSPKPEADGKLDRYAWRIPHDSG